MHFDTGIPAPAPRFGRIAHYPLATMQVGDSAFFSADEVVRIRAALGNRKRSYPGWDYTTRKEGSGGGIRIWRTA